MLMHKTWNVVKSGAGLAKLPPGALVSQDLAAILSRVLQVLWSLTIRTASRQVKAKSEACSALSLKPK